MIHPLLPAKLLVGGGFFVFGYTVVYGGLRRFMVVHVVELSWDFGAWRMALTQCDFDFVIVPEG